MSRCHVYFIQEGFNGPIKIGYAHTDVASRMKSMQTANSNELRLLGTVPAKVYDERFWHARFQADRVRGEWFAPSNLLVEAIKSAVSGAPPQVQLPAALGDPFANVHEWMGKRALDYVALASMIGYSVGTVRTSLRSKQGFGIGFAQAIENVTDGRVRADALLEEQEKIRRANRNRMIRAHKAVPADSWRKPAPQAMRGVS